MNVESLVRRFYAGPSQDGTRIFYDWIRAHATPDARLLNLGAGPPTASPVRILKGEVAEVVGADVDKCVLSNPELDRAVMIKAGKLPLEDNSFDIAFSDYVLEHVENPELFLTELIRVMKPGGQYFFRTPNIYHYVALISAATPHWLHLVVANRARAIPEGHHEPWPTYYRMNSRATLRSAATAAGFGEIELRMVETEPSYLKFNTLAFIAGLAYERTVNSAGAFAGLRANIFGRLRK